jgi:hypothetical protein
MVFGIEKHFIYKVTCSDIDLSHITVENHGSDTYIVYSHGEEMDAFTYKGDKPFDAIHDYLTTYAIENGYTAENGYV